MDGGRRLRPTRPRTTGCSPGPAPPARSGSARGVLDRDGRTRQHGAIPPVDAQIYVTGYRYGGGRRGNVGAGRLTVLRTSIPFVATVTNLAPAHRRGGRRDGGERQGPRPAARCAAADRAVTAEDFERLTLDAAPSVARARCLPPEPGEPVRVLVVPRVDVPAGRPDPARPRPVPVPGGRSQPSISIDGGC